MAGGGAPVPEGGSGKKSVDFQLKSPTCNCAAPAPPVSEGDVIVCNNEKIPLLSVRTFDRNETVDWYSSPNGGSPIFEGNLKFKPNKTGTYYAEARSLLTGCKSGARTPVMLTINQITNAQINLSKSEICLGDSIILSINSNDKLKWSSGENIKTVIKSPLISTEYFVTYEDRNGCADTAFATVKVKETPSIKLLSTTCEISNTSWSLKYATTISDKTEIDSIVGIEDSIYLLSVQGDGCISSIQINKPDCRCSTCDCVSIPAPVKNNGDIFSCQGDPIPPLRVGHQSGVVVDWYDHMNNVLQQGDTVYYPLRDGIYYAQSRSLINPGCINYTRVSWRVTVLPQISLTVDSIFCSEDLRTWGFRFQQNGIFAIQGFDVVNNLVYNIPIDSTKIRIFISNNVCDTTYVIKAPTCPCSVYAYAKALNSNVCYPDTNTQIQFSIDSSRSNLDQVQYSLDGFNWGPESLFKKVTAGKYIPRIRNAYCLLTLDTILIDTLPRMSIVNKIDTPSCDNINGGAILLTISGGSGRLNYIWNNGDTTSSIFGLDSGKYDLTVRDSAGCTLGSTYILHQIGNLNFNLDSLRKLMVCSGVSYPISLSDSFKYIWKGPNNFSEDTSHVVLRDSGWYHVFAFNKADCMAQDSIYLAYGKEFFNARFLLTDEGLLNQKIIVPEISWPVPDSVKWTFDHSKATLNSKNLNQYVFSFNEVGTHILKMRAYKFGCESIVEKSIKIVKDSSGLVQVNPDPKTKNLKSVRLFPNPSSGRFTLDIELNTPSEVMIRVYNVSGISKEARLLKGAASYRESFDLKDLPNGVYSLILQNGSESQVVHFIIQK